MTTDNLSRNTMILSIGTMASKGMQFFLILFVSRWLTVNQFGIFDLYCTYIMLLMPFLSLTTGEAVFRFSASQESVRGKSKYITNGILICVINMTILLSVISILKIYNSIYLENGFCFLLFTQFSSYYLEAILRGLKQLKLYALNNVLTTLSMFIFSFLFVYVLRWELQGLLLAYAMGYLIGGLFVCYQVSLVNYIKKSLISIQQCKELILYSLPLIPNAISWWVMNASDRQIIYMTIDSAANGIYAIAYKIPSLCTVLFNAFSISWQQSVIAKINDEDCAEYFNDVYNKMISVLVLVCAGATGAVFLFYQYFFEVKYIEGMTCVPILISAALAIALMQFYGGIQIGLKKTYENGITTIVGAILNIILNIIFIPFYGLYAAAGATLVSYIFVVLLRRIRLRRIVRFKLTLKARICCGIYVYFLVTFYVFKDNIILDWINLVLAFALFLLMNRKFIKDLIYKKV